MTEAQRVPGKRLGRRPPTNKPALLLADILRTTVPAHPGQVDHFALVHDWGLYGNDKFGVCCAPGTRVLRGDLQWVPVEELAVDDSLLAFDEQSNGHGRKYRSARVTRHERVRRPCYDLEFSDGTRVRCTSEHRWLVASTQQGQLKTQQWCETRHMKLGPTRQTKVIKSFDVWDTITTREGGYLAAAFDGEGNLEMYTKESEGRFFANRLNFTQVDNEMLAEVERCLKMLDFNYGRTVKATGRRMRVDGTPRFECHSLRIGPRSEWIRFMGSVRPERLLPKIDLDRLGRMQGRTVALVRKDFVGEQDVILMDTSSGTYFAEGLASHNCGPVSVANSLKIITLEGTGVEVSVTQDDVFDLYRRSGNPNFDPETGADDNGVDMQTMLDALLKGGIGGRKPLAFAKVDVLNLDEVRAAIAYFGCVLDGVDLQTAQQRETDAGGPWDYDSSPEWGGHAITSGKYTSQTGKASLTSRSCRGVKCTASPTRSVNIHWTRRGSLCGRNIWSTRRSSQVSTSMRSRTHTRR
jgi:hypothetical protein